jgi:hypothetical protein
VNLRKRRKERQHFQTARLLHFQNGADSGRENPFGWAVLAPPGFNYKLTAKNKNMKITLLTALLLAPLAALQAADALH